MEGKTFVRLQDWAEPAHPMVIRLHDDLLTIYKHIREKYQVEIDKAFDRVSQQIGFVVTTTVPIVLEVGNKGKVKRISMGAEHLKDTLFARELIPGLEKFMDGNPLPPSVTTGSYNLQLLWFEALKLKLRTDWMEPAHVVCRVMYEQCMRNAFHPWDWLEPAHVVPGVREPAHVVPGVREPAHWFDPGVAIGVEEAVLISVIDEVYPELRLTDRIASSRKGISRMQGPAAGPGNPEPVLKEFANLLRRYGY